MNATFLSGQINMSHLIEAISLFLGETVKKHYPVFQFTKTNVSSTHWDNQDKSHVAINIFQWEYPEGDPQILADELNDRIAFSAIQVYFDLLCWIQRFCDYQNKNYPENGTWQQVYSYNDHAIFASGGDSIELHCDDNHIFTIIHLSGQW